MTLPDNVTIDGMVAMVRDHGRWTRERARQRLKAQITWLRRSSQPRETVQTALRQIHRQPIIVLTSTELFVRSGDLCYIGETLYYVSGRNGLTVRLWRWRSSPLPHRLP